MFDKITTDYNVWCLYYHSVWLVEIVGDFTPNYGNIYIYNHTYAYFDGNTRLTSWYGTVNISLFTEVFYIPGGCLGFLPWTVCCAQDHKILLIYKQKTPFVCVGGVNLDTSTLQILPLTTEIPVAYLQVPPPKPNRPAPRCGSRFFWKPRGGFLGVTQREKDQRHQDLHTVDGSEIREKNTWDEGCTKPCKQWDKRPTSTGLPDFCTINSRKSKPQFNMILTLVTSLHHLWNVSGHVNFVNARKASQMLDTDGPELECWKYVVP